METATSKNRELNDRPTAYPCTDCGNGFEFTKLGLEAHKKYCSHQESCSCFACRFKSRESFQQRNKKLVDLSLQKFLDFDNKGAKLSENYANGNLTNNLVLNIKEPDPSDKPIFLLACGNKVPEERTECSNFGESSHSDDPLMNQSKRLLYLKPVSFEDSKSKLPSRTPCESSEDKHDGEPCNRKMFCVICDQHISWKTFGIHVLQHSIQSEDGYLVCPKCKDHCSSPVLFLVHFARHSVDHNCHQCHCNHQKCLKPTTISPEDSFCYICLKTLKGMPQLMKHMKIHCKGSFTCKKCYRSFNQFGNLRRHRCVERPHICIICEARFTDPATLRNHARTHTQETPFVCGFCRRGFSQIGNLKRHMAFHVENEQDARELVLNEGSSERTINVVEEEIGPDDETGSGPDLLSDAEIQKTGEALSFPESRGTIQKKTENGQFKLYVCKLCGKKFTWRHDLTIHFRMHTGEKPFKCDLCDMKFSQKGAVRVHIAHQHSKIK